MKTWKLFIGVLLIGVIMANASLIIVKLSGRIRLGDWTEHKLYTLSEGTTNLVTKLNQPIELRLYYSRVAAMQGPNQIRYWNDYFLYVRDLLKEYERLSNGRLTLKVIDPRSFSDEELEAMEFGLKRFQITEDESFFFGLVARTELGKDRVIEFFEPQKEATVEYDITKTISQLVQRDKKRIGLLSSLPILGSDMSPYMMQMMSMQGRTPERPWLITEEIKQAYEIERIEEGSDRLPENLDFLVILHPKSLEPSMLYAIDQFVMGGGRLLVFVDPHCMQDRAPQNPMSPMPMDNHQSSSDLNSLLENWGVRLVPNQIAVDRTLGIRAQTRQDQPPELILPYMELTGSAIVKDEIITANLGQLRVVLAGKLVRVPDTGTEFRPLLKTSELGSTWEPGGPWELQMFDAGRVRDAVTDGTEPVVLAGLLSGTFASNFPDGPPKRTADADEVGEALPDIGQDKRETRRTSEPGATVIVVADVDMLTDPVAYTQTFYGFAQAGDNAPFVLNALDYLAGSEDLISVRTRGEFRRPFTAIQKIEDEVALASGEEIKKIKERIENFQQELQKLGSTADAENIRLIQNEALKRRRELEAETETANRELRALNAKRRQRVESVQTRITAMNLLLPPTVVFLIGAILWLLQLVRVKSYSARRP